MIHAKAWFPLENPGILSVPFGFIGAILRVGHFFRASSPLN